MIETAVVENHIHHHLQSLLVSLSSKLLVLLVGSEAWIYTIVIGGSVTMIGTVLAIIRTVILQDRSKPQGGYAQLVEIIQMLADSLQVATMTKTWCRAVAGLVTHVLECIVLQIAIGKAVGHQHVEHILVRETDALVTRHLTVLQHILHLLRLLALLEVERHLSCLGTIEIEIHQEIVRRIEAGDAIHLHTRIIHRNIGILDILSIHHQLERGILHAHIPVGRFNAAYVDCRIHTYCATHKH